MFILQYNLNLINLLLTSFLEFYLPLDIKMVLNNLLENIFSKRGAIVSTPPSGTQGD